MRKRSLENASSYLDEQATDTERLHDSPQMFKAVRLLQRRQHSTLTAHDESKRVIADKHKVSSIVAKHVENQFQDEVEHGVDMFEGSLSLGFPVTAKEEETPFASLNNNMARCGFDSMRTSEVHTCRTFQTSR